MTALPRLASTARRPLGRRLRRRRPARGGSGWDAAFQPTPSSARDTYVLMAAAARVTERIVLATCCRIR